MSAAVQQGAFLAFAPAHFWREEPVATRAAGPSAVFPHLFLEVGGGGGGR